jgi:hypothetical protein
VPAAVSLRRPEARNDLRGLVVRTGHVAVLSLAVVTVTGIALSGRSVASLDALLLSTYGRLLLAKFGLVLVALAVATLVRRALRRRDVRTPLLRLEALALLGVVGVAGAVASSRPALGTEWIPRSQIQPIASAQVEDVVQSLDVEPNLPGRNFLTVDAYQTRRPAPAQIQRVSVTVQGTAGATTSILRPEGNGRWVLATDAIDRPGAWRISVRVDRPGVPPTTAAYDWTVADPQARLAAPVVSSAGLRPGTDLAAVIGATAIGLAGVHALVRRRRTRRDALGSLDTPAPGASPSGAGPASAPDDTDEVRQPVHS